MIVLDTDVVTLLEYGGRDTLRGRIDAAAKEQAVVIAVITRMERLRGRFDALLKAANETELLAAMTWFRNTELFLSPYRVVEVDEVAAGHFELLRTNRKVKMKRGDMLIACVAQAQGALLVSRNVKDYRQVTGLRVENWAD